MSIVTSSPSNDDNTGLLQLLTEDWDDTKRTLVNDSKWTKDYLTRLTSLSLEELIQEPSLLRSNQQQLQQEAQQLAFTEYPSFLHAESCRRGFGSTLDDVDQHLNELLSEAAPALQQACEAFTSQAKDIVQERAKMTRVLEHQLVLMDLIELPQLMDTCVWNEYYAEAMDLAAHVRLLQVRYPLPVIRTIQEQVQQSSDLMLIQLVSHLRQPIKLAAAMNVIGYLRRMDAFNSENELRVVFLRCRHSYLEQRLERIKKPLADNPTTIVSLSSPTTTTTTTTTRTTSTNSQETFDYLKRYVDVMREQMFEMATQYMSVFSSKENDTLFVDYMTHLVTRMEHTLKEHLGYIDDTSALASLLTQLQYCGMSLGRVGLDFRQLFVGLFEKAMQPLVLRLTDQATTLLSTDTLQASTEDQVLPSTWLNTNHGDDRSSMEKDNHSRQQHPYQPPLLLVDYPCLAIFTNGILTALNALRLLPAIGSFSIMTQHLDACLLEVAGALKQYADQVTAQAGHEEITFVEMFTAAYVRCCVPFLQRCLIEGIYGRSVEDMNTATQDIQRLLHNYLVTTTEDKNNDRGDDDDDDVKRNGDDTNKDEQQQHTNNNDDLLTDTAKFQNEDNQALDDGETNAESKGENAEQNDHNDNEQPLENADSSSLVEDQQQELPSDNGMASQERYKQDRNDDSKKEDIGTMDDQMKPQLCSIDDAFKKDDNHESKDTQPVLDDSIEDEPSNDTPSIQ
ncbi:Dor1-like family-domain-containing protein [Halteromyces radiatus]|uniref:Dor1-like family-domain-containing protein n=1 Tax=Halteromyces radiatus TaxID=101107 RepID=UPI00222053AA|nr:Dor1-like family-domain-containing protein [Halteromyces radiatus]KAI8093475.1 Dor1-like family-domain-containing protein [Halteromyces radiatus]